MRMNFLGRLATVALVVMTGVGSAYAKVWVNEVSIAEDWVELWNDGETAVDLGGWGLSDKKKSTKLFKWTFPEGTTIAAGEYKVIDLEATGFALSSDDDGAFLTEVGMTEPEDACEFSGPIPGSCTLGRNGDRELAYFLEATRGTANGKDYGPPLGAVKMSVERGVYSEAFDVALSCEEDPTARIYYTADHSEPSESNGTLYDGNPIRISSTTVLRAIAVNDTALPVLTVATHSYIFLNDVLTQKKPACAQDRWADWGSTPASYSVSTNVVYDETTKQALFDSIQACPIVSITMSDESMFGAANGLYSYPSRNKTDERVASVEWVTGENVFQIDAGIRIQGHTSVSFDYTPKKSFRMCFRSKYGQGKLHYPVLKDGGCELAEFDSLILRGENSAAWHGQQYTDYGNCMNDQFQRDLQGEISGYHIAGTYVSLFINGLYWGLYNLCERNDADSAVVKFGGNKEDYDVLNDHAGVRDGSNARYLAMLDWIKTNDMTRAENFRKVCEMIDMDEFLDYFVLRAYTSDLDWPQYNWEVVHNPKKNIRFRFFVWDAEYGFLVSGLDQLYEFTSPTAWNRENESWHSPNSIHQWLKVNADYRMRFADHVQKLLVNTNGILVAANMVPRYTAAAAAMRPKIFAESARWGAYRYEAGKGTKIYRMAEWDARRDYTITSFCAKQDLNFLNMMKRKGLYPWIASADFVALDDPVSSIRITVPAGGVCYYTLDGSDPRQEGTGDVADSAYVYHADDIVRSAAGGKVIARVLSGGVWSAKTKIKLAASGGEDPAPNPGLSLVRNVMTGGNISIWEQNSKWSAGSYPNGSRAWAAVEGSGDVWIANNVRVGRLDLEGCVGIRGVLHAGVISGAVLRVAMDATDVAVDERMKLEGIDLFVTNSVVPGVHCGGIVSAAELPIEGVRVFVPSDRFVEATFFGNSFVERIPVRISVVATGEGKWTYEVEMAAPGEYEAQVDAMVTTAGLALAEMDVAEVDNARHVLTINGREYGLMPYYDAKINGRMVTVDLNSNAVPVFAGSEEVPAFEVNGDDVSWGIQSQLGLWYTIYAKENIGDEWGKQGTFPGSSGMMQISAPAFNGQGFYRIEVDDH